MSLQSRLLCAAATAWHALKAEPCLTILDQRRQLGKWSWRGGPLCYPLQPYEERWRRQSCEVSDVSRAEGTESFPGEDPKQVPGRWWSPAEDPPPRPGQRCALSPGRGPRGSAAVRDRPAEPSPGQRPGVPRSGRLLPAGPPVAAAGPPPPPRPPRLSPAPRPLSPCGSGCSSACCCCRTRCRTVSRRDPPCPPRTLPRASPAAPPLPDPRSAPRPPP